MKARPPAPLFPDTASERTTAGNGAAQDRADQPVRSFLFPFFAHQGGWDEIVLVVGPLALIGGALWLANKRVTAQLQATETPSETQPEADPVAPAADSDS